MDSYSFRPVRRGLLALGVFVGAVIVPTLAAEGPAAAPVGPTAAAGGVSQAVERMQRFEGTAAEFDAAAAEAVQAGLPASEVAPLRLMYALRMNDVKLLAAIVAAPGDVGKRNEGVFLLELARGVVAAEAGDFAEMEARYKQAFWTAPELARVVADFAQRGKDLQRIAAVRVPMARKLGVSRGGETTLAELAAGKKAVLLDFWASWCGPCLASMPELKRRAESLPAQGVAVVAINTESDAAKAEQTRAAKNMGEMPWLLDAATEALGELLGIDSIPCAVLVSPEGKVLAKLHPEDPKLAAELAKLGVRLVPESAPAAAK